MLIDSINRMLQTACRAFHHQSNTVASSDLLLLYTYAKTRSAIEHALPTNIFNSSSNLIRDRIALIVDGRGLGEEAENKLFTFVVGFDFFTTSGVANQASITFSTTNPFDPNALVFVNLVDVGRELTTTLHTLDALVSTFHSDRYSVDFRPPKLTGTDLIDMDEIQILNEAALNTVFSLYLREVAA